MVSIAHKTNLKKLRARFTQDLMRLRLKYDNAEISRKTGVDPANLSSYGSGKKLPGVKVLMQFYNSFAGEIQNPFSDRDIAPSREFETQEPSYTYGRNESNPANQLVETLKRENAQLRKSVDTLFAANEKLVQSTLTLVEANRKLVEQFIAKNGS